MIPCGYPVAPNPRGAVDRHEERDAQFLAAPRAMRAQQMHLLAADLVRSSGGASGGA